MWRKRTDRIARIRALLLVACCCCHLHDAVAERRATRAKRWIRQFAALTDCRARYGFRFEEDCSQLAADRPLVIVVHGFNSSGEQHRPLVEVIRRAGFPCGTFDYPNDQPLRESAILLSQELAALKRCRPQVAVSLVTHSMGGLVAREVVENPRLDPGGVQQLIMIAPPNHGSMWALLCPGADLWEHGLWGGAEGPWRRLQASVVDGLAEAQTDLRPGSKFLQQLNARPRNGRVRYSILLGTSAPIATEYRDETQYWCRLVAQHLGQRASGLQRVDRLFSECDELLSGRGDGIVAVKRGRLEGVQDTVLLPFEHLSVTGSPTRPEIRRAQDAVLSRLEQADLPHRGVDSSVGLP